MAELSFRPRRSDDLGLRRALSDRLLPLLVAAMVFLAALALAGAIAAAGLAHHFETGAGSSLTVQVPAPDTPSPVAGKSRGAAVAELLGGDRSVASRRLGHDEIAALLAPWLGEDATRLALDLPAVFAVNRVSGDPSGTDGLAARLREAAPGTLVESSGVWFDRLAVLADSLQACAALLLLVVTCVAAAVVAVATRAGLAARRDAIEIVHGLGATDAMIARQFAGRVTLLAFSGALFGLALAVPMLLGLASLTAPFAGAGATATSATAPVQSVRAVLATLPPLLWEMLPLLPAASAAIGWTTAQATVRSWLAGLA